MIRCRATVVYWLSLLHNFIHQALNSGSAQVHIQLVACWFVQTLKAKISCYLLVLSWVSFGSKNIGSTKASLPSFYLLVFQLFCAFLASHSFFCCHKIFQMIKFHETSGPKSLDNTVNVKIRSFYTIT